MSALRSRLSYANVVSSLALFVALGGGALAAQSAFVSQTGTITACVKKSNGATRIISSGKKCKSSERKVSWNQKGVQGARGLQGLPGTAGAAGAPGKNGTNGTNGVNGTNGTNGQDGATGPTGPSGPTGPRGATGPTGPSGGIGPLG